MGCAEQPSGLPRGLGGMCHEREAFADGAGGMWRAREALRTVPMASATAASPSSPLKVVCMAPSHASDGSNKASGAAIHATSVDFKGPAIVAHATFIARVARSTDREA